MQKIPSSDRKMLILEGCGCEQILFRNSVIVLLKSIYSAIISRTLSV